MTSYGVVRRLGAQLFSWGKNNWGNNAFGSASAGGGGDDFRLERGTKEICVKFGTRAGYGSG